MHKLVLYCFVFFFVYLIVKILYVFLRECLFLTFVLFNSFVLMRLDKKVFFNVKKLYFFC